MHISCCKMVKAKEVDIFPLPKNSIKSHITIIWESHTGKKKKKKKKKKKTQLFKLGKVQYIGGWGHVLKY
jgi:hypothetical protein